MFMEKYLTPIAVLLGALIIAGAYVFGHPAGQQGVAANPNQPAQAVKVNIKDVKTAGQPFIGNANAPVTIAFWFDYQCPFCKKFEQEAGQEIYDTYVKTGKVKMVLKDFQFLGEDSTVAGEFARAMWEAYPDHFYDWYKAMLAAQDDEGDKGFGDLDSIKTLTGKISGVDVNKVVTLLNQKKAQYDAAMAADRAEAAKFGINGTPGTVVGTTLFSGAQPFSAIAPAIDAQLKK